MTKFWIARAVARSCKQEGSGRGYESLKVSSRLGFTQHDAASRSSDEEGIQSGREGRDWRELIPLKGLSEMFDRECCRVVSFHMRWLA